MQSEAGDREETITARRSQLAALLALVDEIVVAFDEVGNVRFINQAVTPALGYEPSSLVGTNATDLMHPDDLELFLHGWAASINRSGSGGQQPERRLRHADGSYVRFAVDFYVGDDVAPFGAGVATLRPVDRTTTTERELRERLANEDRLVKLTSTFVGTTLDRFEAGVQDTLFQLGSITALGRASLLRRAGDHVVLTNEFCPFHHTQELVDLPPMTIAASPFLRRVFAGEEVYVDLRQPDLEDLPYFAALRTDGLHGLLAAPVLERGECTGLVACSALDPLAVHRTTTRTMLRSAAAILGEAFARNRAEQQLAHEARTDSLTGLANRRAFRSAIDDAVDAYQRDGAAFSVLLVDLDRFKVVNDSLGHLIGDQLLHAVAARVREAIEPDEVLARFGGDEMVVLLVGRGDPADALDRAQLLLDALNEPIAVGSHEFTVTVSGGLAVVGPGLDADELLRRADAAMFRAKDRGRRRIEVFDEDLLAEVHERHQWENDLQRAVRNGELRLFYQPEVDLATGQIVGCEALLRWQHPTRGLVDAGAFVGFAEESGSIVDIGGWALAESCRQLAAWQQAGFGLTVRTNLSARQINQPDLALNLVELLNDNDLDPTTLCVEITETAVMADTELTQEVMAKLNGLGIRLAVDDFGTGYSSLAQLTRFPVSILKIDRSFVRGLGPDSDADAIVRAILSLADAMNLEVVAEGVETEQQRQRLLDLGCRRAQGFLFSRAVPADDLEAMVLAGRPLG
jgi:diguanylate cyclase (GGDEF)-like protein/PAS domain S-box-containing protein